MNFNFLIPVASIKSVSNKHTLLTYQLPTLLTYLLILTTGSGPDLRLQLQLQLVVR